MEGVDVGGSQSVPIGDQKVQNDPIGPTETLLDLVFSSTPRLAFLTFHIILKSRLELVTGYAVRMVFKASTRILF